MTYCTFIIPTKGRATLQRALDSVFNQTDPAWMIMMALDGTDREMPLLNFPSLVMTARLALHAAPRTDSAGMTRNAAMKTVLDGDDYWRGKWFAFLDDDDRVHPQYVESLRWADRQRQEQGIQPDVIVFRMSHPQLGILPPWDHEQPSDLTWGQVGISYAITQQYVKEHDSFFKRENLGNPGEQGNEDIELLCRLREQGAEIFLSSAVTYFVRNVQF